MHRGSCLCGAVRFEVTGEMPPPDACHCTQCRGAPLFWDPIHGDRTGIAMGALDGPTDTRLAMHIFVAFKGDYYEITDGLPQHPQ